jgi:hypothetical protein
MEKRIESAGTDLVAMFRQFFDQPKAVNGFLRGVMQNVKFHKAGESV